MPPRRASPALVEEAEPRKPPSPEGDGLDARRVYLQAGQVFATAEPAWVVTVLGSCVAVCLFDPVARVGGVNHYLLPLPVAQDRSPRFGDVALAALLEEVLRLGARKGELRAKVFGGAGVLNGFRRSGPSLGQQNVSLALRFLEREGIPVLDGDVGGERGRKLLFRVDDGQAWVRTL